MGADEVGTLKGLTERRAILDKTIADHRGRIANSAGDSVLAEFGSAVDAVQCAVEAQAALAEANASLPTDKRINFRIGIHVGDVMVRGGDLFGDGVNIAARLQGLARPGGICVSGETHGQVRKILPIAFTDLGAQQVKNIEEPVRAYAFTTASQPIARSTAGDLDTNTSPTPRQAVDRRAPVPEHVWRSRAGVFRRRDGGRHHHRAVALQVVVRYRAQFELHLQGQSG
jgi:adenylate cyclase